MGVGSFKTLITSRKVSILWNNFLRSSFEKEN
jgi:hypothetical protein